MSVEPTGIEPVTSCMPCKRSSLEGWFDLN
jgi:hypothetical protein